MEHGTLFVVVVAIFATVWGFTKSLTTRVFLFVVGFFALFYLLYLLAVDYISRTKTSTAG